MIPPRKNAKPWKPTSAGAIARNDAVDAAEMASEEAGVALYQFEVKPEGRGEIGEVRVR